MNISEAVESRDRTATLDAMAEKVAAALDEAESPRDIAALSKQLLDIQKQMPYRRSAKLSSADDMMEAFDELPDVFRSFDD